MRNIVLIEKETGHTFNQVLEMPYIIFMCHLYWIQAINFDAYVDQLSMFGLTKSPIKKEQHVTEPDWKAIERLGGEI